MGGYQTMGRIPLSGNPNILEKGSRYYCYMSTADTNAVVPQTIATHPFRWPANDMEYSMHIFLIGVGFVPVYCTHNPPAVISVPVHHCWVSCETAPGPIVLIWHHPAHVRWQPLEPTEVASRLTAHNDSDRDKISHVQLKDGNFF